MRPARSGIRDDNAVDVRGDGGIVLVASRDGVGDEETLVYVESLEEFDETCELRAEGVKEASYSLDCCA